MKNRPTNKVINGLWGFNIHLPVVLVSPKQLGGLRHTVLKMVNLGRHEGLLGQAYLTLRVGYQVVAEAYRRPNFSCSRLAKEKIIVYQAL
jgi:hypothetical protein